MNDLQQLARVSDEDLAGQSSGARARALLASITGEALSTVASDAADAHATRGLFRTRTRRQAAARRAVRRHHQGPARRVR
ncbi:hypothetical protein ABGB14_00430 [Nonomuraea sp. B10E15]|uniref:hypothetical protein n=1 Tax=Nonomuraea sp. B10E15 TaxID=3153560 RepID=UPI00325EAD60